MLLIRPDVSFVRHTIAAHNNRAEVCSSFGIRKVKTTPPPLTPTTAMPMLPPTVATSFEDRGPQCIPTRTRSTRPPPPRSVLCACVLLCSLYYTPSVKTRYYFYIYTSISTGLTRNPTSCFFFGPMRRSLDTQKPIHTQEACDFLNTQT